LLLIVIDKITLICVHVMKEYNFSQLSMKVNGQNNDVI